MTLVPAPAFGALQDTAVNARSAQGAINSIQMRIPTLLVFVASVCFPMQGLTQAHDPAHHRNPPPAKSDSAFEALQKRGAGVMGVDQYTSTHRFITLRDGGRIALERDARDTAGVRAIRDHLRSIAQAFAAGDFSASAIVHAQSVPGTAVMRARRRRIRYEFRALPGGGEVRITTRDPVARRAIHEFLAFQRTDHRTTG